MTRRKLFVILLLFFLYELIVWVGVVLLDVSGATLMFGFGMTALAVTVLVVYILFSRLSAAGRPAEPAAPAREAPSSAGPVGVVPSRDDDLDAMASLLADANARLAQSPALASRRIKTAFADLPLYILAGPEGGGKTSNFLSSGLEPELLAGQVYRESAVIPTKLCNLWFAGSAAFVEASGRFFTEDPGRWARVLQFLRGRGAGSLLRSLWKRGSQQNFRGVILFCDVGNLLGIPDSQRLSALARRVQERLRIVGENFGVDFPVYVVFTKSDGIPYFGEYFGRLNEVEDQQILGCTLPAIAGAARGAGQVYAEAETKRLSNSFSNLNYALSEKRLTFLARENVPAKKPLIYEFPRELRRIRGALIQFLVDVFRPNPLQPGPMLRGFYFTGTRKVAASAMASGQRLEQSVVRMEGGATRLFHSLEDLQRSTGAPAEEAGSGREVFVSRWSFLTELFSQVILPDPIAAGSGYVSRRLDLYRRLAFASAGALFLILFGVWLVSWFGNRSLLNNVSEAARSSLRQGPPPNVRALPSLDSLQVLDGLRGQLVLLEEGPPLHLRWGLYAGDSVLPEVRELYFRQFRQFFLDDIHGSLVNGLSQLPAAPGPSDPYDPIYDRLKGYRMITSGACKADKAFLTPLLLEVWGAGRSLDPDREALVRQQFDFYSEQLQRRNPYKGKLEEKPEMVDRGQSYLAQFMGPERLYRQIIEEGNKAPRRPARLADVAPKYDQVLTGPSEVAASFTRGGYDFVQQRIKSGNFGEGERCVLGARRAGAQLLEAATLEPRLQNLYIRDYIRKWQEFLATEGVAQYRDCADAARKLELLARYDSPLLGLVFMTADNTNFPVTGAAPTGTAGQKAVEKAKKGFLDRFLPSSARKAQEVAKEVKAVAEAETGPPLTAGNIGEAFQPVRAVVSPDSRERWISASNQGYVNALMDLQQAMSSLAPGGCASNPDFALHGRARDAAMKAQATVNQIAQQFNVRSAAGVNTDVERLLLAPVRATDPFIITDPTKVTRDKLNGALNALCAQLRRLQDKYPFNPQSDVDVTAPELSAVFAPQGGAVWTFQQQHLASLLMKQGKQWLQNPATAEPKPAPEFIAFFNRLAQISDALFVEGGNQPRMRYTMRPLPTQGIQSLTLELDGESLTSSSGQTPQPKAFTWPGPPSAQKARVTVRAGASIPFASYEGLWAVFQMMAEAEPRAPGSKIVELRKVRRGRRGRAEEVLDQNDRPITVRLEILEFPGGVDAFDRNFFTGLRCPPRAVQ